jgi:hypothetical protein
VQRERATAADLDRAAATKQRDVTQDLLRSINGFLTTNFNGDQAAYTRARDQLVARLNAGDQTLDEVNRMYAAAQQRRDKNPVPEAPSC